MALAAIAFCAVLGPAAAQQSVAQSEIAAAGLALASPDILVLPNGEELTLAGIALPPGGRARVDLAAVLAEGLPESASLTLRRIGEDRHGRSLAIVVLSPGETLQDRLVGQGLAWAAPQELPAGLELGAILLSRENDAREAGLGLWATSRRGIQDAAGVRGGAGEFVIVEGQVRAVAERDRYVYVNFDEDWRIDFTARVLRRNARGFIDAGLPLRDLAGERVRVRGVLAWQDGPMIEIVDARQVEVLP
jgi:micrococcal nuclease